MKKSDLYKKWGWVLEICEGTDVNPCSAWKFKGYIQDDKLPNFEYDKPECFEFLVAILEDKPVFVGNKLYNIIQEHWCEIGPGVIRLGDGQWSWNPPKKTFMLNGETLPCPTKISDNPLSSAFLIGGQAYHFSNWDDCLKVQAAIHRLLQDATK